MRAIALQALDGPRSLALVEVDRPRPGRGQVLVEVRAAGLNFAELEQTRGRYPLARPLPCVMGFEAAGVVAEVGADVTDLRRGDRVAGLALSGGFAEFAVLDAAAAIPIPPAISFAAATTLVVQGLSAYALLELAARPGRDELLLVQAAAGGVGLYLVQLARRRAVRQVIALAGAASKLELVRRLGADVAVDYTRPGWPDEVRRATSPAGVDVILEMASGEVQEACFDLLAPSGRLVVFGAKNMHDHLPATRVHQLIVGNQRLVGFNLPTLAPATLRALTPELVGLVARGEIEVFADDVYALGDAVHAFEALASRHTIGKVVLEP